MNNRNLSYVCFCFVLFFGILNLNAQSKKKLKKYQVKYIDETITKKTDGLEETFKDVLMKVDFEGNVIEMTQFKKDGSMKSKTLSKYNKNGDLIQEEELDGGLKLKSRKTMSFNIDGEKISESEFDNLNRLIKKSIYIYDSKGFKVEKQVFDGNGKLILSKKIKYMN